MLHRDPKPCRTPPPAKPLAKLRIRVAIDSGLTPETPLRLLRARISLCGAERAGENRDRDERSRVDRQRELPV